MNKRTHTDRLNALLEFKRACRGRRSQAEATTVRVEEEGKRRGYVRSRYRSGRRSLKNWLERVKCWNPTPFHKWKNWGLRDKYLPTFQSQEMIGIRPRLPKSSWWKSRMHRQQMKKFILPLWGAPFYGIPSHTHPERAQEGGKRRCAGARGPLRWYKLVMGF